MKAATATGLIVASLWSIPQADAGVRDCAHRWFSSVPPTVSTHVRIHRSKALLGCVFRRVGLGSQVATAWRVAAAESHFTPWAWNRASDCRGLMQQKGRFWPSRVLAFIPRSLYPNTWPRVSAFVPLANALVSARMVRAAGDWHDWTTA